MPLEFRGNAAVDPETGSVRFAGFPNARPWQTRVVICQVTKSALQLLSLNDDDSPERLLATFEKNATLMHGIASSEFDTGDWAPTITEEMLS